MRWSPRWPATWSDASNRQRISPKNGAWARANGSNFRKGRLVEAAALWPKASGLPASTSPIVARISKLDYRGALIGFRSALPLAQLGRADEACQAYAEGIKHLGPAPSAAKPRDLGESYDRWYLAEAHRREAEQMLRAKGIAIPQCELPSK